MKTRFFSIIVGLSVAFAGVPAYGGGHAGGGAGGGHGGFSGGGHAGFSSGTHFSGAGHGYTGGISRGGATYGGSHYSPAMSTGRYDSYHNYGQSYSAPRTSTGRQIYATTTRPQSRIAREQFNRSPSYSGSYYVPQGQSSGGFARKSDVQRHDYSAPNRDLRQQRAVTAARGAALPNKAWSRQNASNRQQLDPQTKERLRNWGGNAPALNDAKRNHDNHWRDRHHHDHDWWRHNCDAIVFIAGGFWGWYDGWWYPAWGYDPYYSYYDYNGPIYGYDGLRPDEIIANVQGALQQLGYYDYAVDGVLGPATETAIANYQRDNGLPVTGAIDPVTVRSLGLSS